MNGTHAVWLTAGWLALGCRHDLDRLKHLARDASVPDADAGVTGDAGNACADFVAATDPCAADQAHASCTVGCNEGIGEPAAATENAGACEPGNNSPPAKGSCGDMALTCVSMTREVPGVCARRCTTRDSYVSRSDCPSPYRCFQIGGQSYCMADCTGASDCGAGLRCTVEKVCAP